MNDTHLYLAVINASIELVDLVGAHRYDSAKSNTDSGAREAADRVWRELQGLLLIADDDLLKAALELAGTAGHAVDVLTGKVLEGSRYAGLSRTTALDRVEADLRQAIRDLRNSYRERVLGLPAVPLNFGAAAGWLYT